MSATCKTCGDELDADGLCMSCAHNALLMSMWHVFNRLDAGEVAEARETARQAIAADPYQRQAWEEAGLPKPRAKEAK